MPTPNYAESTVSGTLWKRVCRVVIENPLDGTPSLIMVEEEVFVLGDKQVKNTIANLSCTYDANDPDDVALYNLLNAKYVKLRTARDTA